MFEISPVSFQKQPQNGNKQKITVVDMVSTTVTDLVAGEGLEPTTSGLWAALRGEEAPLSGASLALFAAIHTIASDLRQILQAKSPSDAPRSIRWSFRMGQSMGQTSRRIMEAALAVAAQRYRTMPNGSS